VRLLVYFLFCDIISTDEDPGLRIESFAVINLRGVSTNKTIIYFIAMQTYKELNIEMVECMVFGKRAKNSRCIHHNQIEIGLCIKI
jgi:hypothetical protein